MAQSPQPDRSQKEKPDSLLNRLLDGVEKVGNKLPDPAVMFFWPARYCLGNVLAIIRRQL